MRAAVLLIVILCCMLIGAAPSSLPEDVRKHPVCPICGMDRQKYSHSRMMIDYREGPVGTCSIHCTGVDIAVNRHKTVRGLLAADYAGKQLIPAKAAFWVIGGKRSGVMTNRAKWAFGKLPDAEAFIGEHGGRLSTFDDAIKATFDDMYTDIKAVRDRTKERKVRDQR